jgi:hypothetical protein
MASRRLFDGAQQEIGSIPIVGFVAGGQAFVNVLGVWKTAVAWVKASGAWKLATGNVNDSGTWKT